MGEQEERRKNKQPPYTHSYTLIHPDRDKKHSSTPENSPQDHAKNGKKGQKLSLFGESA
jgi:hypothetical protein